MQHTLPPGTHAPEIAPRRSCRHAAARYDDDLDEVDQALAGIVRDANRAAEDIARIRALIKKAPVMESAVAINEVIIEVIDLTRGEVLKHGVSLQTQFADDLPLVQGDRVQIQQGLLNLIINAVEAMRGCAAGARELLISTRQVDLGSVLVTVRDSGPGFTPAMLEHVFEAFHTTKPRGLGLGLSICRSIIEAHGGRLWASANVPRGAVFQFSLPARQDQRVPHAQSHLVSQELPQSFPPDSGQR